MVQILGMPGFLPSQWFQTTSVTDDSYVSGLMVCQRDTEAREPLWVMDQEIALLADSSPEVTRVSTPMLIEQCLIAWAWSRQG